MQCIDQAGLQILAQRAGTAADPFSLTLLSFSFLISPRPWDINLSAKNPH